MCKPLRLIKEIIKEEPFPYMFDRLLECPSNVKLLSLKSYFPSSDKNSEINEAMNLGNFFQMQAFRSVWIMDEQF